MAKKKKTTGKYQGQLEDLATKMETTVYKALHRKLTT